MIRRPPRSTPKPSSAASDVYKRQHLDNLDHTIDCDVLVCGNDPAAREVVVQLAADAGMKAWHAGVIANSIVAEAMTSTLIFMNNRYKIDGADLKITGTPGSAS